MTTKVSVEDHKSVLRTTGYSPDPLTAQQALIRTLIAGVLGAVLTTLAWFVMHSVSLPAYNTSTSLKALSSASSLVLLFVALVCAVLWLRGTRRWVNGIILHLTAPTLVLTSLGLPLSATRLWLDGIQVDQGFRTQFLSRMTETASNADMNYLDLPSFYPIGWFWIGGRLADVLGVPGWEVFQPWALITLAAGAAMLTPVWQKITGSLPVAAAIAIFTTAVVLTETPDEPYAAVVAMFFPAATVITYRALIGSRNAIIFMALYLGISASFYTLYTAIAALFVVTMSVLVFFIVTRDIGPFVRLFIIGVSSLAIASITWAPYLMGLLSGQYHVQSTANHFLPEEGTVYPLPFFSFSIIGILCMLGLILIVVRADDREVASIGVGAIVSYAWCLASMAATLLGTSLLGFRVEVLIIELFVTAGILAVSDIILVGIDYFFPSRFNLAANQSIIAVIAVVVASACLLYVQQIPSENQSHIDQAYADTDGYGERADKFPPDAAQYYGEVTELLESHGHRPNEAVIYTDEINYMAYTPYFGFNAFTSHYANPLGEFALRNEALIHWSQLSWDDPKALTATIDESEWEPPAAFIFRGDVEEPGGGFKTHVAHDIFPNEPNVRYEGLFFNAEAFEGDQWHVEQIGPFAVVVRT